MTEILAACFVIWAIGAWMFMAQLERRIKDLEER